MPFSAHGKINPRTGYYYNFGMLGALNFYRVNPQGDIEVRRHDGWDVIGGLIGEFEHRVREETGLDWA